MNNNWQLKATSNINQMLRLRTDKAIEEITTEHKNLIIIKHQYHIADDIMFPDPSCLAFFTAFEQNHLQALEDEKKLILAAVDIFEGNIKFYIYCTNHEQTVYDCISFLKSNSLYKCEFEILLKDNGNTLKKF